MQTKERKAAYTHFYLQRQYQDEMTCKRCINIANEKAKLHTSLDAKRVHPIPNKKISKGSGNQSYTLEYELNVQAMIAAFNIGTGGFDIMEVIGKVGIPEGKGWERQYHRHSPLLNNILINLADTMMKQSLIQYIDTTISEKLKTLKYKEEGVRSAIKPWHEKDMKNIPHHILRLEIAISFHMGWQKRATGKQRY